MIHVGEAMETSAAQTTRTDWAAVGYDIVDFSLNQPRAEESLRALLRQRGHEIAFILSVNFWALNVRKGDDLLHCLTGIPLVIQMHDHPVYFLHQISHTLDGAIIVTPGEDLPDFIAKHYPIDVTCVGDSGARPLACRPGSEPSFDDFLGRHNAILWPMNLMVAGQTLNDVWQSIIALPRERRKRIERLLEASLYEMIIPLHRISEGLTDAGDAARNVQDLLPVLNYIKLWRRTQLLEALIDLPILVSSNYVPAEIERKYPEKLRLLSVSETVALYGRYRFIANVNPLIHCLHERIQHSLTNNSVCITDTNSVIARIFEDGRNMVFVDYACRDVAERVAALIDDPARAFAMTRDMYRVRTDPSFGSSSIRELLAAVEVAWAK